MVPHQPDILNWLFIDMDSFYASVEQHLRPELRGRIVAVVPVQSEGTCVIAASASAKRLGIKVGVPVRDARQLCSDIVLVKARPSLYVKVHHAISRSIDRCVPFHKAYSIDEWAVRLVGAEREPVRALDLGRRIKREILKDFSPCLTCSIGIAPTRLLAKIACDLTKPDGLTALHAGELPGRLEDQRLDFFPGIARGMLRRLHAAGVYTTTELWNLSPQQSRRIWGSVQGEVWWHGFHGNDLPEPPTHRHSINHAHVLPPTHRDDAGAHSILVRLLCKGAVRLRCHNHVAHRLHVFARTYNGRNWSAEASLQGTQETLAIVRQFESLWQTRPWADRETQWSPFAQVSITLSGLMSINNLVPNLFEEQNYRAPLSKAIDRINLRWGQNTLFLGSIFNCRQEIEDKIAFGRIPDEIITPES